MNPTFKYMHQKSDYFKVKLASIDQEIYMSSITPVKEIYLLFRKCEIYLQLGDIFKAGKILEIIDKKRMVISKRYYIIDFLFSLNKGILTEMTCQSHESQKWYQKAQMLLNMGNSIPESDISRLFNAIGNERLTVGDTSNAIDFYNLSLSRNFGNSISEKVTKLNYLSNLQIAAYYSNRMDLIECTKSLICSLVNELEELDHPELLTYFFNNISIYINQDCNLQLAKEAMDQVANILIKYYENGFYQFGLLYYYQGQYAYLEGDYEKAFGYIKESENYLKKYPCLAVSMYQIEYLLANIYFFYKKDYKLAIYYYEKVQQSNNFWIKTNLTYSYLLAGYAYLALGEMEIAINIANKGLEHSKGSASYSNYDAQTYAYRCISGIYKKAGKKHESYMFLSFAYENTLKLPMSNDLKALITRDIGSYYKNEGNYMLALNKYQQALIECSSNFTDTSIFANPVKTEILTERVLIETLNMKAFALYLLHKTCINDLRFLIAALQCQELSLKFSERRMIDMDYENSEFNWIDLIKVSYNNAISYATMLYNLTGNLSYFDKCLRYAEKSKMLVMLLNNHKKNSKIFAGIPDSLIKNESYLKNEVLTLKNRLYNNEREGISNTQKQALIEKIATLQLELDQLTALFEKSYKKYFDLKYNLNVSNIHQIQAKLKEDQIFIEYQLLSSELIQITISKKTHKIHLIPHKGQEIDQILNFRQYISENPIDKDLSIAFNEFTKTSHYLYNWLIKPIEKDIYKKKLIIVPHNELNLIPFELLISELPSDNQHINYKSLKYLFYESPISYSYSGTLLFDNQSVHRPVNKIAYFLPNYSRISNQVDYESNDLVTLDGAKEEVYTTKKIIGGELYEGIQANETTFKSETPKYKIIHISSHTKIDNLVPSLSSLIFSAKNDSFNDGFLHSYEIYQLNLNAQLVVLSGCNTGFGRLQNGEGLLSLARSFFYTGVRSIIYTLWTVPDKTSANIVTEFYRIMNKGRSLDIALQMAKKDFLNRSDPVKSHPYFWSGYVLTGKTNPLQMDYSLFSIILLITLGAFGFLTLWIYGKFRN